MTWSSSSPHSFALAPVVIHLLRLYFVLEAVLTPGFIRNSQLATGVVRVIRLKKLLTRHGWAKIPRGSFARQYIWTTHTKSLILYHILQVPFVSSTREVSCKGMKS